MELIPKQINKFPEKSFSEVELENITGLCEVLQSVRIRLISEGYSIDKLRAKFNTKMV